MDYIFLETVFFAFMFLATLIKAAQLVVEEVMEDYIH